MSRSRQSLPFSRVFAFAGAKEAPRNLDLAGLEGALKFTAADFEDDLCSIACKVGAQRGRRHDLRRASRSLSGSVGRRLARRGLGARRIRSSGERFVITQPRPNLFGIALDILGASGPHRRLIPIVRAGHLILNIDFGLGYIAVNFRVHQRERHLGHAGGLALARAREDDVLHVDAAQQSRRLLAQHPGNGVGNVRLAAAVWTHDRRDAFALKAEVGTIAERLESKDLQLL